MEQELFVEKPQQIALGIPLGAGITYLSWKYPGIIQKAMWDVLYGKVMAHLYKKMSMGTILLYMSEGEVDKLAREAFDARYFQQSALGRATGIGARWLGRAFAVYAIYDSIRLAYDIGIIYGGHLESATGGVSGDPESQKAFAETHHRPGLMRN